MREYWAWAAGVVAFVKFEAERQGVRVLGVRRAATTRSVYVRLRRGPVDGDVRVSDHPPPKKFRGGRRPSMFNVGPCMGLADLEAWLRGRFVSHHQRDAVQ